MSHVTRFLRIGLRNSLAISRRYKSGDLCKPSPQWIKLKKTQEKYAQETGRPVHLINGSKDQLLYRITWALTLLGLFMSLYQLTKYFILPQ